MLLSYNRLCALLDAGILTHSNYDLVNSASIDIRLGSKVLIEHTYEQDGKLALKRVSLKDRTPPRFREYDLEKDGPLLLFPGEFILAHSFEIFNLPNNISAEYKLKSSMARIGLEHLNAGWCDAGWNGSVLTLELKNLTRGHEIELNFMDKIGQVVFFQHEVVPADKSYATRGRYNNDKTVSSIKLDPTRTIVFGDEEEEREAEIYAENHPVTVEFEVLEPKKSKIIVTEGEENNE